MILITYYFQTYDTCNFIQTDICIFHAFCLITWYLILAIWNLFENLLYSITAICYLLPLTWYLLLATRYLLPVTSTCYLLPVICLLFLIDCTGYLIDFVRYLLSETCHCLPKIVSFHSCSAPRSCFEYNVHQIYLLTSSH